MTNRTVAARLIALAVLGWSAAVSAQPVSPYAGQQTREIKALSPKEIEDLVHGRGMGLAKSAELNRYPGPLHALELAGQLELSPEQRNGLETSKARMSRRAQALGAEILSLERKLDAAFAQRSIDLVGLEELTTLMGVKQGMLRAVHLEAHIETAGLLTPEQIARYELARGYEKAPLGPQPGHGTTHHGPHRP